MPDDQRITRIETSFGTVILGVEYDGSRSAMAERFLQKTVSHAIDDLRATGSVSHYIEKRCRGGNPRRGRVLGRHMS